MPRLPITQPRHLHAAAAGVVGLAGLQVLALWWGSRAGGVVESELAAVFIGHAAGLAALAGLALNQRFSATPLAWVLVSALLLRLFAAAATPLLEDDHYRYLWDGLRTATALDPYRLPPEAFFGDTRLAPIWQDVLSGINHPELPTLYGPVLQGLFALAYAIGPGQLWPLQGLLVVADMAVLLMLARWGVGKRWLWAYALHPMVLKEALASAHPDGLVALLLLGAAAGWRQGNAWWVGLWLGAACATKVSALAVLPLLLVVPNFAAALARERWAWAARVAAGAVLAVGLLYLPFALSGGSELPTLRHFAEQWRFNPLLYRALEGLLGPVARPMAALALVAVVVALAWRMMKPEAPLLIVSAMAWALFALLLLAPVNNPWYALWLLPLAVLARHASGMVLASVTTLSYLNGHWLPQWLPDSPYGVPWASTLVQLAAIGAALAWDLRRHRGVAQSSRSR